MANFAVMSGGVSEPAIRLQGLGAAAILVGDQRMTPAIGTMFAVLVRVLLSPGYTVSADAVRGAFWGDQTDDRQRGNLRQVLYKLRQVGVRIGLDGEVIALDASQVVRTFTLDRSADAFERDVIAGDEPFGVFLPHVTWSSSEMAEWLESMREVVHADVRRVVAEQMRRRRERADWSGAEVHARWLLQFDPLSEEGTLTLAECLALSGSKREAVALLDRYVEEVGAPGSDLRVQASVLRRRILEPPTRTRVTPAAPDRHFIGRDADQAALTLAIRRARWQDGSAELLHGPAGIGKSRLVQEVVQVAELEGISVVEVACRESDQERPLSVLLDLLPELLERPGALGCAPDSLATLRRLVSVAAPVPAASIDGMASSTEASPHGNASTESVTPRASVRRAMVDLMAAVADERPMVLVVEDVHWIDEHAWEVLADLIDRVHAMRLCIVLTSREPHPRLRRPARMPSALHLRPIRPLSDDAVVGLARAMGHDLMAPVSDTLGAWFVSASEGNPLYLRALVNHWIETGEAGGVPPTLREAIDLRLNQLSGDALRVLQTAALLGKWATAERISSTLELRANNLLASFGELARIGSLPIGDGSDNRSHDLIERQSLERLSKIERQFLHLCIAKALRQESERKGGTEIAIEALDHLFHSGDATEFARQTAASLPLLISNRNPQKSIKILERAEQIPYSDSNGTELTRAKTQLLSSTGEYTGALKSPTHSVILPTTLSALTDDAARALVAAIDSAYRADKLADHRKLANDLLQIARTRHIARKIRMRAIESGLIIYTNLCDQENMELLFALSELTDDDFETEEINQKIALVYFSVLGDRNIAIRIAEQLARKALNASPSIDTYTAAIRAGFALRIAAKGRSHLDAFENAFSIATAINAPTHGINASYLLAHSYLDIGEYEEFSKWTDNALKLHEVVDRNTYNNIALLLCCRREIERGSPISAERYWEQYLLEQPKMPPVRMSAYNLSVQSEICLLDRRWIPSEDLVMTLSARQERVAAFGTSDYVTSVTARMMARLGMNAMANSMLLRYFEQSRRELTPPSQHLQTTLLDLGLSITQLLRSWDGAACQTSRQTRVQSSNLLP